MSLTELPVDCITVLFGFLDQVDRKNAAITCKDILVVLPKFDPEIVDLGRNSTAATVKVSATDIDITITYFKYASAGDEMLCSVASGRYLEDVKMSMILLAPTESHTAFCGDFACEPDVTDHYIEKFAAAHITPRILRKMYDLIC